MGDWLKDRVAVVTGAGGGLGKEVCLAFAEQGAKIVVNDLGGGTDGSGASTKAADVVVDEIKKRGGKAAANYDSVATMQGGENIIKTAMDAFGTVDIVVTCAGILRDRMIFNMAENEWDGVIATHLKGTFSVVKAASQVMRQKRYGRIITFTSTSGLFGNIGQANYSTAKSAIAGFSKVVALDLGRYGITVNTVAPMAATRMTLTDEYLASKARRDAIGVVREGFGYDPQVVEMNPKEVPPLLVYLASEKAGYINGQAFFTGGGIISLVAPPRLAKTIYKPGRWTVDELIEWVPQRRGRMGLMVPPSLAAQTAQTLAAQAAQTGQAQSATQKAG